MFDSTNFLNSIWLFLCRGIYWFAEKTYGLFIDIAEVNLFTQSDFESFSSRIYVLLGVMMLFKLSFSLINYIVNPDSFSDKDKGMGKLVKNVMVVLLLIIIVPYIFDYAYRLQKVVIGGNVIPNLVLGIGRDAGESVSTGNAMGQEMAFQTFSAFFTPTEAIFPDDDSTASNDGRNECINNLWTEDEDGRFTMKEECATAIDASSGTSYDGTISEVYTLAFQESSINILANTDIYKATTTVGSEKIHTFDVNGFIALIAGGFLGWIFLMFCFDIAVRSVKLVFLQLIAPIPIIAYADPKGQSGVFKKWVNNCVKTYLDLFVRLIAIYFAILVISMLGDRTTIEQIGDSKLVFIFIMFGVLLFAKQLPKLIEDIAGVKMSGDFTLRPMNKLQQVPLVGAAAGMAATRIAGGITAARNDHTGHRIRRFFEGGSAAAHEMRGKIPLSGLKPGSQTVRSVTDARKIGYKLATGNEMRAFSPLNWVFGRSAEREYFKYDDQASDLKRERSGYETAVKSANRRMDSLARDNAQSNTRINELRGLRTATTDNDEIRRIDAQINSLQSQITINQTEMDNQQAIIEENENKIRATDGVLKWLEDQQKDLAGAYSNVDESSHKTASEVTAKYEAATGNTINLERGRR